jgi:hypothetical protein
VKSSDAVLVEFSDHGCAVTIVFLWTLSTSRYE